MVSKIEQTIDDIYDYLEGCKYARFSNKESIIVNKDDIYELLEELKRNTPEEIQKYKHLIENSDMIMNRAKESAARMLSQAEEKQSEMIEKNEVMQQAYSQAIAVVNQANMNAQDILNQATTEASNYQMSAIKYTDDSLAGISDILTKAINDAQSRYSDLISSLNECLKIVTNDRTQLALASETEMLDIRRPQARGGERVQQAQGAAQNSVRQQSSQTRTQIAQQAAAAQQKIQQSQQMQQMQQTQQMQKVQQAAQQAAQQQALQSAQQMQQMQQMQQTGQQQRQMQQAQQMQQTGQQQRQAQQTATPKAPVIDKVSSIREEINDDDIDDI